MRLAKFIYIILIAVSCFSTYTYYKNSIADEILTNNLLKQSYIERIKLAIYSVAQPIAGFERIEKRYKPDLTLNEFNMYAEIMYDPEKHIAITYSPAGITEFVFPFEENKEAIGHNILTSPKTMIEGIQTIENKQVTISGPYSLLQQGRAGIVIRDPIFVISDGEEKFWGFTTLVLASPKFLSVTGILNLESIGYAFSLLGEYQDESVPVFESSNYSSEVGSYQSFQVYNSTWKFSIYKVGELQLIFQYSLWLLGFFLAGSTVLYKLMSYFEERNREYKHQIERDSLTGAYTRVFLDEFNFSPAYTIFYIDLNKFKPVNDNYGHEVGDKLLKCYVMRLKEHFKKDTPVVRMGGDEFMVIINQEMTAKDIEHIKSRINLLSSQPFKVDSLTIQIGASVGYAVCPQQSKVLDELIKHADRQMYQDKESKGR